MFTYEVDINGKIFQIILAKSDLSAKNQASKVFGKYTGSCAFGSLFCRNDDYRLVGRYLFNKKRWVNHDETTT